MKLYPYINNSDNLIIDEINNIVCNPLGEIPIPTNTGMPYESFRTFDTTPTELLGAKNTCDNDTNTYSYFGPGGAGSIKYNLGQSYRITKFKVLTKTDQHYFATINYSTDNVNWFLCGTLDLPNTPTLKAYTEIELDITAQYWQFAFSQTVNTEFNIYEVYFYSA